MPSKKNPLFKDTVNDVARFDLSADVSAETLFGFIDNAIYYKGSENVEDLDLYEYKHYYKCIINGVESKKNFKYTHKQAMIAKVESFEDNSYSILYKANLTGAFNTRISYTIINEVMRRYRISKDTIEKAVSRVAEGSGDGIKKLSKHPKYFYELKLHAMGGERIYSTHENQFFLDVVANHT